MNLSESLAQYTVESLASFLAEEGMMTDTGVGKGAGAGAVAAGGPVTDTSDEGPSFQMAFPCIAEGTCDANDLNRYLRNWQESDGGAGLADILGAWGGGAGGAAGTPIDGGADAAGPAVGGGGGGPAAGTNLRGERPDAAVRRRRTGGGGGGGIGTP